MSDQSEKQTLVEEGTEFSGTLKANCKVVVRGAVEGELEAPSVDVTAGGRVTGNVKAKSVRSQGSVAGSLEADEVSLAGEVKSDTVIRAKSLEVKLSADKGKLEVTFGDCVLDVGEMPTDEARAEEPAETKKKRSSRKASSKAPESVEEGEPVQVQAEATAEAPAPAE